MEIALMSNETSVFIFAPMLKNLVPLDLPQAQLKLARKGNQPMVWDIIRKKYLVLTPEEWVRQHLLHHLVGGLGYPLSNVAIEAGLKVNGILKRTDMLVYKNGKPTLLVECKAPQVKITQEVLDQASTYNLELKTPFVLLTNGLSHFSMKLENDIYKRLENIPDYEEL